MKRMGSLILARIIILNKIIICIYFLHCTRVYIRDGNKSEKYTFTFSSN